MCTTIVVTIITIIIVTFQKQLINYENLQDSPKYTCTCYQLSVIKYLYQNNSTHYESISPANPSNTLQ